MATLSDPKLSIDLLTGSEPNVTVTVTVGLTPFESFFLSNGLSLQLVSKLVGDDRGISGGRDDDLFFFPTQNVTRAGIYTFQSIVSSGTLNEDNSIFNRGDEIFANFNLRSTEQIFPLNVSINSPTIEGSF